MTELRFISPVNNYLFVLTGVLPFFFCIRFLQFLDMVFILVKSQDGENTIQSLLWLKHPKSYIWFVD